MSEKKSSCGCGCVPVKESVKSERRTSISATPGGLCFTSRHPRDFDRIS